MPHLEFMDIGSARFSSIQQAIQVKTELPTEVVTVITLYLVPKKPHQISHQVLAGNWELCMRVAAQGDLDAACLGAARSNWSDMIDYLIQKGGDPTKALEGAIRGCHIELISYLLCHHIKPDTRTIWCEKIYWEIGRSGCTEILDVFPLQTAVPTQEELEYLFRGAFRGGHLSFAQHMLQKFKIVFPWATDNLEQNFVPNSIPYLCFTDYSPASLSLLESESPCSRSFPFRAWEGCLFNACKTGNQVFASKICDNLQRIGQSRGHLHGQLMSCLHQIVRSGNVSFFEVFLSRYQQCFGNDVTPLLKAIPGFLKNACAIRPPTDSTMLRFLCLFLERHASNLFVDECLQELWIACCYRGYVARLRWITSFRDIHLTSKQVLRGVTCAISGLQCGVFEYLCWEHQSPPFYATHALWFDLWTLAVIAGDVSIAKSCVKNGALIPPIPCQKVIDAYLWNLKSHNTVMSSYLLQLTNHKIISCFPRILSLICRELSSCPEESECQDHERLRANQTTLIARIYKCEHAMGKRCLVQNCIVKHPSSLQICVRCSKVHLEIHAAQAPVNVHMQELPTLDSPPHQNNKRIRGLCFLGKKIHVMRKRIKSTSRF